MRIPKRLMLAAYRVGSYMVYGTTAEANWIYEKVQRPSSCFIVAMNLLYWKLRRPRVRGIVALILEPVFDCNLRCTYCPWSLMRPRLEGLRPRLMTWETFCAAVDTAPKTVETIQFSGLGEPLMHPRICDMIERVADRGKRPSLFTNGTLLKGDLLRRLAQTPLSVLNLSLEPDAETCRKYRGIDLDTVRKHVEEFVALKQPATEVKIRMVVHPGNVDRLGAVWDPWRGLVDDIKMCPVFTTDGAGSPFLCMEPWRGNLTVWTNGKVTPCCLDTFEDLVIGNIHKEAFAEIIHGKAYRDLLNRFTKGAMPDRCANCSSPNIGQMPTLLPRKPVGRR